MRKLETFLEWLETSPALYTIPPSATWPDYAPEVDDFVSAFYASGLEAPYDPAVVWRRFEEEGTGWLENASLEEAYAALTACVRSERFGNFALVACIEKNWLQASLRRALATRPETGPSRTTGATRRTCAPLSRNGVMYLRAFKFWLDSKPDIEPVPHSSGCDVYVRPISRFLEIVYKLRLEDGESFMDGEYRPGVVRRRLECNPDGMSRATWPTARENITFLIRRDHWADRGTVLVPLIKEGWIPRAIERILALHKKK